MNAQDFIAEAVKNTVLLQPFILALTTLYGKFGAQGRLQLGLALLTGFVLGILLQIAALGVPSTIGGYIAFLFYGLVPGLLASGVYEVGKQIANKKS